MMALTSTRRFDDAVRTAGALAAALDRAAARTAALEAALREAGSQGRLRAERRLTADAMRRAVVDGMGRAVDRAARRVAGAPLDLRAPARGLDVLRGRVGDAAAAVDALSRSVRGLSDAMKAGPRGYADGGPVRGPGGPREDRVLARLSPGEFVVNAGAASRHRAVLEAINRGDALPGYADGGRVAAGSGASGANAGETALRPLTIRLHPLVSPPLPGSTGSGRHAKAGDAEGRSDAEAERGKAPPRRENAPPARGGHPDRDGRAPHRSRKPDDGAAKPEGPGITDRVMDALHEFAEDPSGTLKGLGRRILDGFDELDGAVVRRVDADPPGVTTDPPPKPQDPPPTGPGGIKPRLHAVPAPSARDRGRPGARATEPGRIDPAALEPAAAPRTDAAPSPYGAMRPFVGGLPFFARPGVPDIGRSALGAPAPARHEAPTPVGVHRDDESKAAKRVNSGPRSPGPPMPTGGATSDRRSLKGALFGGESEGGNPGIYNYSFLVDAKGKNGEIVKKRRYKKGYFDANQMTVSDLQNLQNERKIFAAGSYQIIPETMRAAVKALGLRPDDKFDAAMQDRIFTDFLAGSKHPQIGAFITGGPRADLIAANRALALEWASVGDPDKNGATHYTGTNNKASITLDQAQAALIKARDLYKRLTDEGVSAETARRAALLNIEHPTVEPPKAPQAFPLLTPAPPNDKDSHTSAARQRDAERAVLPRAPTARAPERDAMSGSLDVDHSGVREAIHHVRALKAELASLGTASVEVRHSGFGRRGDHAPGAVRAALNAQFGSDGRAFS